MQDHKIEFEVYLVLKEQRKLIDTFLTSGQALAFSKDKAKENGMSYVVEQVETIRTNI